MCLACLEPVTSGRVWLGGTEITTLAERQKREVRRKIQVVFQDPASSLNPRFSAIELVAEPLQIQGALRREEQFAHACGLLERVGIPRHKLNQRPEHFSGGQRQRIAIARALALEPRVLILDEALAALDCSVQAQIVNVLLELQQALGLTYLYITHDLVMAAYLADEIAVMHSGRVVERAPAQTLVSAPQHEITQRLLAASGAGMAQAG